MSNEYKIKAYQSVLNKQTSLNGLLSTMVRAEKIGIDFDTILLLRNRRAYELKKGKYSSGFRLG